MNRDRYETRYVRASVRQHGAIGKFYTRDFAVRVLVQGGHAKLVEELIAGIHKQGYEVNHIDSHSLKRDCL